MTYNYCLTKDDRNLPKPIENILRNSDQFVMPACLPTETGSGYNIFPAFTTDKAILRGYGPLCQYIAKQPDNNFILDGYGGVQWELVRKSINDHLIAMGISPTWICIDKYLKDPADIDEMIMPAMGGDDPLFGKIYDGELLDFFDAGKLEALQPDRDSLTILYGSGSALVNWVARIIYFDLPKNEIQFRSRAARVVNLGADGPAEAKAQYKRFYFIDWPVLNKHKQFLLPKLDVIVDEQRPDDITWMSGSDLRQTLGEISSRVFRARPWFEPGVWGGQWIKNNISQLNCDVVNYAWSFELIAPENGIVFSNNNTSLEVSFDTLIYHDNVAILGKAAKRFGYKFPIRFDFLDTVGGDNLSLQCHPSVNYTKENFGEDFTQDETYYILEANDEAKVYLGFQENIDQAAFRTVLEDSFESGAPVEVEDYIQAFPAKKHDLFLIPNGTVHCSGRGNLVLEISATPYIFTFKMYDWIRPDLSGVPRTLNIDRAFENLNFDRKGQVVSDTLLSKTRLLKKGPDWETYSLSTHPDHFYAIERLEFDSNIVDVTNDHCLVLSLVEGESITVKTGDRELIIHYAETFIIPAIANIYTMRNNGPHRAKVIKSYVKDECC